MHPGTPFNFTSVQYLLKNPSYIAMKEVGTSGRRLVDAVWPGIVDQAKFEQAQHLLSTNHKTCHNGLQAQRHTYVLSGRLGTTYFYYVCRNKECGLRASAEELEGAVLDRLSVLDNDAELLIRLTDETNARLQKRTPALERQLRAQGKALAEVKAEADKVLREWSALEGPGSPLVPHRAPQ